MTFRTTWTLWLISALIQTRLASSRETTTANGNIGPRIGKSLLRRLKAPAPLGSDHPDEPIHVLIGYNSDVKPDPGAIPGHSIKNGPGLQKVNAAGSVVTKDELDAILADPNVAYVEEDSMVYPTSTYGETFPYGIVLTQGVDPGTNTASTRSTGSSYSNSCSDESSFKIALIDSGLDWDHPDVPCNSLNASDTNCIGQSFSLSESDIWYDPTEPHGTHVFGIVAGSRTNHAGISGMLTDESDVCFIICQIFSKKDGARASTVIDAAEWAIQHGAKIINMSLGGGDYIQTADLFFDKVRSSGIMAIAAAGNGKPGNARATIESFCGSSQNRVVSSSLIFDADGTEAYNYPAAYSSVIAVAAVDSDLARASFSQHNDKVDIAAPGEGILSSVPVGKGDVAFLSFDDGTDVSGAFMQYSTMPPASGISGELVVCSDFGSSVCEGDGGHICLIERGENTFEEKVLNCERSGGIAAVISNNVGGVLAGALVEQTVTTIPVLGISDTDGDALVGSYDGRNVSVTLNANYEYMSGTSMAAPHVTGAAAQIWRSCPSCTSIDVETCLFETAHDLGNSGKDEEFGVGLLQTRDAYECLVYDRGCCSSE